LEKEPVVSSERHPFLYIALFLRTKYIAYSAYKSKRVFAMKQEKRRELSGLIGQTAENAVLFTVISMT
jgi:hypothetical protein